MLTEGSNWTTSLGSLWGQNDAEHPEGDDDDDTPSETPLETWLLMEYCDKGCLLVSLHSKAHCRLYTLRPSVKSTFYVEFLLSCVWHAAALRIMLLGCHWRSAVVLWLAVSQLPSKCLQALQSFASLAVLVDNVQAHLLFSMPHHYTAHRIDKRGFWVTRNQALQQHCFRLQDAVDKGWLLTQPSHLSSKVCLKKLLQTALELANAMAYLHGVDIMHGDLTGGNIMLHSAAVTASDPRGFTIKVLHAVYGDLCFLALYLPVPHAEVTR